MDMFVPLLSLLKAYKTSWRPLKKTQLPSGALFPVFFFGGGEGSLQSQPTNKQKMPILLFLPLEIHCAPPSRVQPRRVEPATRPQLADGSGQLSGAARAAAGSGPAGRRGGCPASRRKNPRGESCWLKGPPEAPTFAASFFGGGFRLPFGQKTKTKTRISRRAAQGISGL